MSQKQLSTVPMKTSTSEKDASFLTNIDFSQIDEMDPNLFNGHKVVFESDIEFEIKLAHEKGKTNFSMIEQQSMMIALMKRIESSLKSKFQYWQRNHFSKILIQGEERHPLNVKIELTSDNDIFFLYQITINEDRYKLIQEQQGLTADFYDFPAMFLKMLNNCLKPGSSFVGCFTLDLEEKRGSLEFFQDTEYRRVDLLRIDMESCDEETLKNQITYRISSTKQKTILMQERLKDIMSIVKEKNPILLQEIYKGTQGQGVRLK